MDRLKAILVDDEKDSREILANYLSKYCKDVQLMEKCDSVATGLKAIENHEPDIVFLDIEMPYGNGFDLLDQVGEVMFETVFVTAYDNYAIQALNQSAAYYLLKPIDIDELIQAVDKIKNERARDDYMHHTRVLLDNLRQSNGEANRVMLPTMEGFEIVLIDDIIYCEADDNFTRFHLQGPKELLICRTLKHYEETLPSRLFFRVHRSHMVNLNYVVRYAKGKGGFLTLENGVELEVAEKKKTEFLSVFRR